MNVRQLEVKCFATDKRGELSDFVSVFHGWIRTKRLGETLLLDVADYSHVPNGPGVMLLGDGLQYRLDNAGGELGLLYARKRDSPGPAVAKLRDSLVQTLRICHLLEQEPALAGTLSFRTDRFRVQVMCRLAARNTEQDRARFVPAVHEAMAHVFGQQTSIEVSGDQDPRAPLTVDVRLTEAPDLNDLVKQIDRPQTRRNLPMA